jgi:ATP-binding cassette subfamily B protein
MEVEDLRAKVTALFQMPVAYHDSPAQNIVFGDLSVECTLESVERAARLSAAHSVITRLPHGYDTLLGKWFSNGTELSAGEWQRLSTARTFYKRAPIVALDEPTSFIDSWTEAGWFERFRAAAEGCTAIIITHRLTVAMRADRIHVMENGCIVESGTHDELLARGGLYAESWNAQTQSGRGLAAAER